MKYFKCLFQKIENFLFLARTDQNNYWVKFLQQTTLMIQIVRQLVRRLVQKLWHLKPYSKQSITKHRRKYLPSEMIGNWFFLKQQVEIVFEGAKMLDIIYGEPFVMFIQKLQKSEL